jgi:hypothetical protein
MLCRHCGIDIAEKALICYRCGTATTEAKFAPPAARRRGGQQALVMLVLALVLVVLLALYFAGLARGEAPREIAWAAGILAAVLLVLRVRARRR